AQRTPALEPVEHTAATADPDRALICMGLHARTSRLGVMLFVMASACAYYLLNAPILLGHFDLGWHLAAGDLIRQQGAVPPHDPWSFTAATQPWLNLSWLWDVLASALYQQTHLAGLVILTVACGAAIAGC